MAPSLYEYPRYHASGALLADSRRSYTWDAAGRLTSVSNGLVSPATQVAFEYYPDGRRARKSVRIFTNGVWTASRSVQYAWQGWKLTAECERDASGSVSAVRHFVWGPDIVGQQSASLDSDAEGVGGLLLIREWKPARGERVYLPISDGQGSVCALIDASDGSLAAEFDYDPYGTPVVGRGPAMDACPFRHRTRYYDPETWLYYYGYRYYDPSVTKWISKDPLGEAGGWNLTAFCDNDPVNTFDALGLAGYFFGGTGNNRDEGMSNVEILFEAWDDQAGHGRAFYVPGVFSGYSVDEKKYGFLRKRPITEGAAGRTLGLRAAEMMKHLETSLSAGDKEVNVFGFSRGSVTALEFLNRIQNKIDSGDELYKGIKINFVALWDTVKTTVHDYPTELPSNMRFEHQPLHFIAIDEQRAQFFNKEVLNLQGALQIGYRGVHADVGGFQYPDQPRCFGWLSRNDAISASQLLGIRFKSKIVERYKFTVDWSALPSENDTWFYNGGEARTFPADMYLHWSVRMFGWHSRPYNDVTGHPEISRGVWLNWAGR